MNNNKKTLDDIKKNTQIVANCFESLAKTLTQQTELSPVVGMARQRVEELRSNKFTVMVVGEFKRGKTTLLNAMLGAKVMPTKLTPCTAIVTYIRYGEKPEAVIEFTDGRPQERLNLDEYVQKYQLNTDDTQVDDRRALSQEISDRFGAVDRATIYYPSPLLLNGIEIVDTPGINEHDLRTQRVLEKLVTADAIIMVLDAVTVCNQNEASFIENQLRPLGLHKNVFFLLNRWNFVTNSLIDPNDPEELESALSEQMKFIKTRLYPFVKVAGNTNVDSRIFKVNALGALQCRLKNIKPNEQVFKTTEIPAFEESLSDFLVADRDRVRREKDIHVAKKIKEDVDDDISFLLKKIKLPIEEFEASTIKFDSQIKQLKRIEVNITSILNAESAEICREFNDSLKLYMEENLYKPLPDHIEKFDMGDLNKIMSRYSMLLDFNRSEEEKIENKIKYNLESQIKNLVEDHFKQWMEIYFKTQLNSNVQESQIRIRGEAKEYVKVLSEIHGVEKNYDDISENDISIKINDWLINSKSFSTKGSDVIMDLSPLVASIIAEVLVEVVTHKALALTGVGLLLCIPIAFYFQDENLKKFRCSIVDSMIKDKEKLLFDLSDRIEAVVDNQFKKITHEISSSIGSEIGVLRASINDLKTKRQQADFDAEAVEHELKIVQLNVYEQTRKIYQLVADSNKNPAKKINQLHEPVREESEVYA